MADGFIERMRLKFRRNLSKAEISVRNEFIRGEYTRIREGVLIDAENLYLGDGVTIEPGVIIEAQDLYIGDYTSIKRGAYISGTDWCYIGANCWIGYHTIIDSIGTTYIGNNVGIGAHSQLWSHIRFGDTLKGCRFESSRPLWVGDDVWFVGHCIVSPIKAEKGSMALVGSVVTRDMEANHIYAGVPASDVSEKMGFQFEVSSEEERKAAMDGYLDEFYDAHPSFRGSIDIVDVIEDNGGIQFDVMNMEYSKTLREEEVAFMRYLLPTRAKFIPVQGRNWVYDLFTRRHGDIA